MRVKLRNRVLAGLSLFTSATLIAFTGATSASASPTTAAPVTIQTVAEAVSTATGTVDTWVPGTEAETASLVSDYESSLRSNAGFALNKASAESWDIGSGVLLLRVPVADGQDAINPSAVSLIIDPESDRVTSALETIFIPRTSTSGVVQAWVDGNQAINELVTSPANAAGATVSAAQFGSSDTSVQPAAQVGSGEWWGALNECLANQGIPAWILAGLSSICGAACIAAATPPGLVACALCVAAASGFASGIATNCIIYANNA